MNPRLTYFLGTFFYSGAAPKAPGTFGSIAAAGVILSVEYALAPVWWWALIAAAAVFIFGVYVGNHASTRDDPDPKWFVLDEVAGMLVAVAGQAHIAQCAPWLAIIVAFVMFRVFDILKPPPIRQVEHFFKRGLGIMADDILAGMFAWALTSVLLVPLSEYL